MKSARLALALLATAAAVPAVAQDQRPCTAGDLVLSQVGELDYDATRPGRTSLTLEIRNPGGCEPRELVIEPQTASNFHLYLGSRKLESVRMRSSSFDQASANRLVLSRSALEQLAREGRVEIAWMEVLPGQYEQPGFYSVNLSLQDGERAELDAFAFGATVLPAVLLQGDAADGEMTMSLGEVSSGAEVEKVILVRTNSELTAKIYSENSGVLVHEDGRATGTIGYDVRVDGRPVSVASPTELSIDPANGALTRTRVNVTVAPALNRFAGRYRDVLTLEFTAL